VTPRGRGIAPGVTDPGWDTIDLKALRFNGVGSVMVPGFGNLHMTPHAMRQLGGELGVRWTKFFGHMSPDKIQRAVTDHLRSRTNPTLKRVIARKHGADAILSDLPVSHQSKRELELTEKTSSEGVLRGFVSPTYTEIRDARVFNRIDDVAEPGQLDDQGIAIYSFRDNGSHFMLVNREPIDLLTAQTAGGKIGDGQMGMASGGAGDAAFFGIRIRNSEVGSYALSGHPYFVRFVCTNGIIVGIKEEPLLYRQHRGISDAELDRLIGNMYNVLPERQKKILDSTKRLQSVKVEDPEAEINTFLSSQSKTLRSGVLKAYEDEPIPTAYGIMQAIARTAMASRRDMDRQLEIEKLAGMYMRRVISSTSN